MGSSVYPTLGLKIFIYIIYTVLLNGVEELGVLIPLSDSSPAIASYSSYSRKIFLHKTQVLLRHPSAG